MRAIRIIINENGQVFLENLYSFEGEHNSTKLFFNIPKTWETFNKYLDAFYTDLNGVNKKIQFPPIVKNENGEFTFLIPQILTFSQKVKFQFSIKNIENDIIQMSDIFELNFKKSILAELETIPVNEDIINDLVTKTNELYELISSLDIKIENTIQWVFEEDEGIKALLNSTKGELEQSINDVLVRAEEINDTLLAYILQVKQEVKDEIINGAPVVMDTLLEISNALQGNPNIINELLTAIAAKVDKETGKGLSELNFTSALKQSYDVAAQHTHTHTNKAVIDLITDFVKQGYDNAAAKAHEHGNISTLHTLDASWKAATDDVIARLAGKWLGSDIALNQIGITHLTTSLQQLIGSNNNITNYPDNDTLESFVENSINKLRIKDLGINSLTKINWQYNNPFLGFNFDGVDDAIVVLNNSSLNPEINTVLQNFSLEIVGDFSQNRTATRWIIGRGSSGGGLGYSFYYHASTSNYVLSITTSGGEEIYNLSASLVPLKTKSIIITINWLVNKVTFYVDGINKQERTITKTGVINVNCGLAIGAYKNNNIITGNSSHSKTPIYLYRQYNKALTEAECLNIWNNGRPDLTILNYYLANSTILEISAGSLIIGKMYKITARTTSDFTTVGAANNNINTEFIATGNGAGLLDANNKVTRVGNVLELRGENFGDVTCIDTSGNNYHGFVVGSPEKFNMPLIQKAWTGNFTTNIAVGVANRDMIIPAGYIVEMITLRNTTAGNITNFQAILNPATWNILLFSNKTIAQGATLAVSQLADRNVDTVNSMTLRFNCTGNSTGGIDIMVLLRRKD